MAIRKVARKLRLYWSLIKSLQAGLLLSTALAGYMSAPEPLKEWHALLSLLGSMFCAIAGSTVLNMVYDRDIDAQMVRTCWRPLPSGQVTYREALTLGIGLSVAGVGWSLALSPLYGAVVFAGWFFDVVVYTLWLKRRTAWSIVWGGLSGGMPVLAGRALALGAVDWIGIALALSVLFWIPTHILTFTMRYDQDYRRAKIPTFPATYGFGFTRAMVAISSVLAGLSISLAALAVGMTAGYLHLLAVLSSALLILSTISLLRPSDRMNFSLFKFASLYMLSVMLLFIVQKM